jgi:hypothetical protein
MVLDQPTKSIQAFLAAGVTSAPLQWTAGLISTVQQGLQPTIPTRQTLNGTLSGVAPVTLIPAPYAAKILITVDGINIYNADSAAATVTVSLVVSGIFTTWYKAALQPGDNLFYQAASDSWYVVAKDGSVRGITPLPLGAATDASVTSLATMTATQLGSQNALLQAIYRQLVAMGEASGVAVPQLNDPTLRM